MRQVTTEGSRSSPFQVWRSMLGGSTSSTSQSTTPFQPGTGLPTNLKWLPTSAEKPSGRPPRPVEVQSGTSSGSVSACQSFPAGCGYSRVMWNSDMTAPRRRRYRY